MAVSNPEEADNRSPHLGKVVRIAQDYRVASLIEIETGHNVERMFRFYGEPLSPAYFSISFCFSISARISANRELA